MIVQVKTNQQIEKFNQIWMESWKEKGFEIEVSESYLSQFLFKKGDEFVATIEFKSIENSSIIDLLPLGSLGEELQFNINRTIEVDKLSIQKDSRKKGLLSLILSFLIDFAINNNVTYYVGLLEPNLYAALKNYFEFPLVRLSKDLWYKGDYVVPIKLDITDMTNNIFKYNWYRSTIDHLDGKTSG
ncbi:hypothetical protein [Bacillus cereus group sp. BfR-BA-01349]|uniref:hypothetical protein n=1 Tax=Bacillus cereus group sp. BfR-BA-01349 TaxID=2920312 RepID=UPI001F5890E0